MLHELTRHILSLERLLFPESFYSDACDKLQQMSLGFQKEIGLRRGQTAFDLARSFRYYLSSEGFSTATKADSKSFTLCGTLLNNAGSCLGLTTLHLALGEIADLSMRAALFEGHIVPVYMDGETPIYIETTRRSSTMYEYSIRQLHGEPIKLLSNEEFLAVHLSNQATLVYARAGLLDDAVFLIDSALELFPDYTAGWINRAALMKKLDNTKEMRRSLDKAKSLNPGFRYTQAIEQIEGEKHE